MTVEEIAANDYSLTPGRRRRRPRPRMRTILAEKLREIHDELAELNDKAAGGLPGISRGCWDELANQATQ